MAKIDKIPELSKTLSLFMGYFSNSEDGGASFIQMLILPDGVKENAAVKVLYDATIEACEDDIEQSRKIIKIFQTIREFALKDNAVKKELEGKIQQILETKAIRKLMSES